MDLSALQNLQGVSVLSTLFDPEKALADISAKLLLQLAQLEVKPDLTLTVTNPFLWKSSKNALSLDKNKFFNSNTYQKAQTIAGQVGKSALEGYETWANQDGVINTGSAPWLAILSGVDMLGGGYGTFLRLGIAGVNGTVKGLNQLVGKKNGKFAINQTMADVAGGEYSGKMQDFLNAQQHSGEDVAFYKSANTFQLEKRDLKTLTDMAMNTLDSRNAATNTHDLNSTNWFNMLEGGPGLAYAAKLGAKIELLKKRNYKKPFKKEEPVKEFKQGGIFVYSEPEEESWKPIYSEVPEEVETFQKGGKTNKKHTIEEIIEYVKNLDPKPRFIQRLDEPVKSIEIDRGNGPETATHLLGYFQGDDDYGPFYTVYPQVQEDDEGNLQYYVNPEEAFDRAEKHNNIIKFRTEDDAKLFTDAPDNQHGYKLGWPEFFKLFETLKYKQGGKTEGELPKELQSEQQTIIPEGALHAHKHHMEDDENITKKGIPVVDMLGELQAEIERDEIIFNLTITNKLEELYKEYYQEGTTQKRKDELALEAGKILTCEIINNVDDKTGLIDKCEKGGKL